jgi:hypothetical protein
MKISFKPETAVVHGFRSAEALPWSVESDCLKRDWLECRDGIGAIARRHGIRVGALRRLARAVGWPARRRGRTTAAEPPPRVRQMLEQAWQRSYGEVAKEHAVSKQRVGQIVRRWGAWAAAAWGHRRAGRPVRPPRIRQVRRGRPKTHILTFRIDAETASMLERRRRTAPEASTRSVHDMARQLVIRHLHGGVKESL